MEYPKVKRNVLLNPGPATTTDTVKYAQVVPDICPREKEFGDIMKQMGEDLVKIVHGDLNKYTAVLFTGSGTINIDACVNSLVPEGKKILVLNNGAYSARAAEVAEYYHMDHVNLKLPITEPIDVDKAEEAIKADPDIAVVYCCHHETGTGVLNPIREIGAVAHKYGKVMVVDTTSTYAMIPIDMDKDNLDFIMASAQKGLMSMTGLSYVIGNTEMIEASKNYPTRSYYTNLFMRMTSSKTRVKCTSHLRYRRFTLRDRQSRNTGKKEKKASGLDISLYGKLCTRVSTDWDSRRSFLVNYSPSW